MATDPDSDPLTYVITGGTNSADFRIDAASGQLMIGPTLMVDYDADNNISYNVVVTAYDPAGEATDPASHGDNQCELMRTRSRHSMPWTN